MPFNASPDHLRVLCTLQHRPGHWSDEGPLRCISSESGGFIHVWSATGELQGKDHPSTSRTLEARLSAVNAGRVS